MIEQRPYLYHVISCRMPGGVVNIGIAMFIPTDGVCLVKQRIPRALKPTSTMGSSEWSPPSPGLTDDPEATLDQLFHRLVPIELPPAGQPVTDPAHAQRPPAPGVPGMIARLALLETLLGDAADELEEHASGGYPHRNQYPSEMLRYRRALETPNRIRAALSGPPMAAAKLRAEDAVMAAVQPHAKPRRIGSAVLVPTDVMLPNGANVVAFVEGGEAGARVTVTDGGGALAQVSESGLAVSAKVMSAALRTASRHGLSLEGTVLRTPVATLQDARGAVVLLANGARAVAEAALAAASKQSRP